MFGKMKVWFTDHKDTILKIALVTVGIVVATGVVYAGSQALKADQAGALVDLATGELTYPTDVVNPIV